MSAFKEAVSTRETFAELYGEYLDKVFRYVQYRVNDMELAEDLTSAVFEKVLVNFAKYSSDKASFSTWIFSIARNTVIDYYRTNRERQNVPIEKASHITSGELLPAEELERKEEVLRLQQYLTGLAEEEQEIIRLKFGAEFNNRQIARMLGISETNVGTKLYRAVRKLRDSFQEINSG